MQQIKNKPYLSNSYVVREINEDPELKVKNILCDMVERRLLRGMKNSNSTFGCEICKATGNNKHWPCETQGHPFRTEEECRRVARYILSHFSQACNK